MGTFTIRADESDVPPLDALDAATCGLAWTISLVTEATEEEIREGMRLLMTRAKLCVEGSGAAATAALLAGKIAAPPGARVVAIVSGGNVDLEKLASLV